VAIVNRLSRKLSGVENQRDDEGMDAFVSEESLVASALSPGVDIRPGVIVTNPQRRARVRVAARWAGLIASIVLLVGAGAWAYQQYPVDPKPASFTLQTTPAGLQVQMQGKPMGVTPLNVSLPPGDYAVALSAPDGRERTFNVTLTAGGSVVQQLEMAAAAPAGTGALRVETTPSRQPVVVDGVERGMSPVTVSSLAPGEHVVVIRSQNTTLRRTIDVNQGETVSLVMTVPAESNALRAGWVTFTSPIPLSLREGGRVIGTTDADRLMLPVGEHEIEMANDALGFRATRRVTVASDRTTPVAVQVPNGTVSINALPWAEVWIGGERVGETPLANLSRPIGSHEVVLRHPQFGERRARVTVSSKQTARLGVDMRAP
jgi:hypothetical protein